MLLQFNLTPPFIAAEFQIRTSLRTKILPRTNLVGRYYLFQGISTNPSSHGLATLKLALHHMTGIYLVSLRHSNRSINSRAMVSRRYLECYVNHSCRDPITDLDFYLQFWIPWIRPPNSIGNSWALTAHSQTRVRRICTMGSPLKIDPRFGIQSSTPDWYPLSLQITTYNSMMTRDSELENVDQTFGYCIPPSIPSHSRITE